MASNFALKLEVCSCFWTLYQEENKNSLSSTMQIKLVARGFIVMYVEISGGIVHRKENINLRNTQFDFQYA